MEEKQKEPRLAQVANGVKMFAGALIAFVFSYMAWEANVLQTTVNGSGRRARGFANLINLAADALEPVGGMLAVLVILIGIGIWFLYQGVRHFRSK